MARFVTITNASSTCWGCRKHTITPERKIGRITATVILGTLLCCAGFFYIYQVNRIATMGYEIKQLEKEIETLNQRNERLKIHSAELKSIHSIETEKDEMQMKKPQEIGYIEVEHPVAMK